MTIEFKKITAALIRCAPHFETAERECRKRLDAIALDKETPTDRLFEKALEINDRLILLCNAAVLNRELKDGLKDGYEILRAYAFKERSALSYSAAYRAREKQFAAAEKIFKELGYDENKLVSDFGFLAKKVERAYEKVSAAKTRKVKTSAALSTLPISAQTAVGA